MKGFDEIFFNHKYKPLTISNVIKKLTIFYYIPISFSGIEIQFGRGQGWNQGNWRRSSIPIIGWWKPRQIQNTEGNPEWSNQKKDWQVRKYVNAKNSF